MFELNWDNEQLLKCTEKIDNSEIFIKDTKSSTSVLSTNQDYHFKIENTRKQAIKFIKIDKCVFNDGDKSKCDFAFANDEKIHFVEVKEIEGVDSLSSKEGHNKRKNKRKEAKYQLAETINEFKNKYQLKNLDKVYAIITLVPELDVEFLNLLSIKDQEVIENFVVSCGCPNIFEGNHIIF